LYFFPEGGVPDEIIELDDFKDAEHFVGSEHQIIVPMVFRIIKAIFVYFSARKSGLMR
jgi:hypothetical protein